MNALSRILITLMGLLLFVACSTVAQATARPAQGNNPYAAQPADAGMLRGDVRIDSAQIALSESNPPQVMLKFAYFQPTPCFKLRVETSQPDAQKRINLSAYAVAPKDKVCTLMALSTPLQASLSLGSFPAGHYSLWLNGQMVGAFDS